MARNSVTSCMSQNEKGPQLWKTVPDWALFQISLFCFWGFWDFWGYGQCFNDNQWMGNGCRINGWSASHPSGVSKCPNFSHHSTIGDILSPTDTLVMFNPPKGDTCQPLSMDLDFIQKRLLDCCPFPTGNGRFAATCMILMGVIPWLGVVSGEVASCRRKHVDLFGLGSGWNAENSPENSKDIQHYRMNHPTSSVSNPWPIWGWVKNLRFLLPYLGESTSSYTITGLSVGSDRPIGCRSAICSRRWSTPHYSILKSAGP